PRSPAETPSRTSWLYATQEGPPAPWLRKVAVRRVDPRNYGSGGVARSKLYRPLTSRLALSRGDTRARSARARGCPDEASRASTISAMRIVFHTRTAFERTLSALTLFIGRTGIAGLPYGLGRSRRFAKLRPRLRRPLFRTAERAVKSSRSVRARRTSTARGG